MLNSFSVNKLIGTVQGGFYDVPVDWVFTYGNDIDIEVAYSVIQTSDGKYVMAGHTNGGGALLVKVNSDGTEAWSRIIGGFAEARAVVQTTDGYVVAGNIYSGDAQDFWLVKTYSDGNLVPGGEKIFTGPNDVSQFVEETDECYCMIQTSDGGFVLGGQTGYGADGRAWLVKARWNGMEFIEEWRKAYEDTLGFRVNCIAETTNGDLVLGSGAALVKTDPTGEIKWIQIIEDFGTVEAVVKTSDGYAVAADPDWTDEAGWDQRFALAKTDLDGNKLWGKSYHIDHSDEEEDLTSMIQTSDGGYVLVGECNFGAQHDTEDWHVIKTDSDGEIEWSVPYDGMWGAGIEDDIAYCVIEDSDKCLAIAGFLMGDAGLIKLASGLNLPPTISPISGPTTVYFDIEYTWSAVGLDPDGDLLTYEWILDGIPQSATGNSFAYTFISGATLGNHKVRVRAVDEVGETSSWSDLVFTLEQENNPPTISQILGSTSGVRNKAYTFTAKGADADGDILTYEWTVDGILQSATGSSLTYTFTSEDELGDHTIKVRVKDTSEATSDWVTLVFTLEEQNNPPTIGAISGPTYGLRDVEYTWTVTGSDPDGDDLTYDWKVDGETQSATDNSLSYTFDSSATVGSHKIIVRALDEAEKTSAWSTLIFSLENHLPTISSISGPTYGLRDVEYTWTVTGSDPDGDDLTYDWYVDGTRHSGDSSFAYTFSSVDAFGSHSIKVRARDEAGGYSSYSILVFKLNEEPNDPPTIGDIDGPDSGYLGETYTWTVSATDPDEDEVTINWYIDGVSQATGTSFTYTFETETPGECIIEAVAEDDRGAFSEKASLAFTLEIPESGYPMSFEVTFEEQSFSVGAYSNSTVTNLLFTQTERSIRLNVTGVEGTTGFCNLTFPSELLSGDFTVFMDATVLVEGVDYTITSNSTHHTLSITYDHSTHTIEIVGTTAIPDFAGWLLLPFVMLATLLSLALNKRLKKQKEPI